MVDETELNAFMAKCGRSAASLARLSCAWAISSAYTRRQEQGP